MVSVKNLQVYFTTSFSGCLQRRNIFKGAFLRKYLTHLSCWLFSKKKASSLMFDLVVGVWLRVCEILGLLLFQVYKLSQENTQPENMCVIVFEKTKGRGGTVNRTSVYVEAAVQSVLWKKYHEKIRGIHKKRSVPESLFW